MPRINDDPFDNEEEFDDAELRERERDEFEAGFKLSQRGNWWRIYQGMTVTVFQRDDDIWAWSIADADGVRYSPENYEDTNDALASLVDELSIGAY